MDFLKRQKPSFIFQLGILLVAIFGIADYLTGPELFFLPFYLIPVILVAWFVGEIPAATISGASAVCWFIDEVIKRPPHTRPYVVYLNISVKLFVFLLSTRMVLAFKAALEREKKAEEERMQREIEIAHEVQERLLPQTIPPMNTLDYTGTCIPVYGVGGDYYDFLPLEEGRLAIAIGDVSGKGISSALLMATFKGMLHSHAIYRKYRAADLVCDLNRYMSSFTDHKRFVTFFYGLYDDSNRTLIYVNAGHNPPIIFRNNGAAPVKLLPTGLVIGLFPQSTYREEMTQLSPGDILVCFTDGVTEALNGNEEEFEEERLIQVVSANRNRSACDLRDLILAEVNQFSGKTAQRDDETLVVARVR